MVEPMELRAVYCREMMRLAEENPRLVTIDADLQKAAGMTPFAQRFPERALDVGVAEANMIGVAAGLATMGYLPVAHSFTPFATRRCFDQITVSVAYAHLTVKIVGSDPGIASEVNGGTHLSIDDVGLMRGIPGIAIVEPVDEASMVSLLPQFLGREGIAYMRLFRKPAQRVYEGPVDLRLGVAHRLREGGDVAILASGLMVHNALVAADALSARGIRACVLDVHTIKPLDVRAVREAAWDCGCIVTAENHSTIGGLGSAVAECLAEAGSGARLARVGIRDRYGLVGFRPYLEQALGLSAAHIEAAAMGLIKGGCAV